jgi:hypothetical protein
MRSDRPAMIADPIGSTAALESNYAGATAPEFPAPTGAVGERERGHEVGDLDRARRAGEEGVVEDVGDRGSSERERKL